MKIRLAKKIMKANLEVYPFYWHRRWTPYHLYVCTVNKPWGGKERPPHHQGDKFN